MENGERKRSFQRRLYIKAIFLPRRARDQHKENSKKTTVFSQVAASTTASTSLAATAAHVIEGEASPTLAFAGLLASAARLSAWLPSPLAVCLPVYAAGAWLGPADVRSWPCFADTTSMRTGCAASPTARAHASTAASASSPSSASDATRDGRGSTVTSQPARSRSRRAPSSLRHLSGLSFLLSELRQALLAATNFRSRALPHIACGLVGAGRTTMACGSRRWAAITLASVTGWTAASTARMAGQGRNARRCAAFCCRVLLPAAFYCLLQRYGSRLLFLVCT